MARRSTSLMVLVALAIGHSIGSAGPSAGRKNRGPGERPRAMIKAEEAAARGDYERSAKECLEVIGADPGGFWGASATDLLAVVTGTLVMQPREYECPDSVHEALRDAEKHFRAGRTGKAVIAYEKVVGECPRNPRYWVHYSDAYFVQGDYARAKELLLRALEADRWNREAHRFLADTEAHLGNPQAARREATLAVISDPTYEVGWYYLDDVTQEMGGRSSRLKTRKAVVKQDDTGAWKHVLVPPPEETAIGDLLLWTVYGAMKGDRLDKARRAAIETEKTAASSPTESLPPTALQIELASIEAALELHKTTEDAGEGTRAPFFGFLVKARRTGFLTEAIFMHLLDSDLVEEYERYRDAHADRLVEYVETVVAPIPAPKSDDLPH